MARGFLSGSIWGVVICGAAVGALSVATGPLKDGLKPANDAPVAPVSAPEMSEAAPADPVPQAPEAMPAKPEPAQTPDTADVVIDAPEPSALDAEKAEPKEVAAAPETVDPAKPGRRPTPETAFETPQAPGGALDAPEAPFAVGADTASPEQPVIGDAPAALSGAEPSSEAAQVSVATDGPVQAIAQADIPGAPKPETSLDISTDPAQPPAPAVPTEETALLPEEGEGDLVPAIEADVVEDAVEDDPQEAPETVAEVEPEPEPIPEPVADTQDPEPEPAPEPAQIAVVEPEPEAAASRPSIGKPAGSLLNRDSGITTSRLPRLGGDDAPEVDRPLAQTSPLIQFAATPKTTPAEGQPQIAVILIDDKVDTWGPEALKTLPLQVSIAIPPSHPEAAKTAAAYRKLGFEVLAMADIPAGAQPSDVEVTLSGTLQAVPEAIAVLEDPNGGVQSSRAVSDQTTAFLAESGHGLVMMPKGLNTAQQLAAKAGVPSASLFRDMDRDKQDAAAVRRALDQAVFRAKQDGSVVMLGRLHANTISGLIQWGLQDKNASISIVPVSTVLMENAKK
ncbi:divergent polysaccharide deacetylase family protein [uncultured Pelagimonas sp.]|uniref:divergent polysaccharide deacetylase family protein n=1 Tax=uncultured Pelagimonas sp. TaxID=1618102 RepID=UPI00260F29FF|nr:divergent polysaccharide deacetylase family protein [uncultured Pelagimonas sp.]